jgi:DNA-binding response OmpR family regulator
LYRRVATILIIEDDPKTANAIHNGLRGEGYDTTVARTGEDGAARLASATFDLVLLDWMLPGRDGITLLRQLRADGAPTPVLRLTARSLTILCSVPNRKPDQPTN